MPENTIKVASVVKKESKKGKDFWVIKDGNDDAYFAWEKDQADLAQQALDNGLAITIVHEGGEYKTVKEIQGPKAGEQEPAGTRAKVAPEDMNATNNRVALMQAVAAMTHTIASDATPKQAWEKIGPLFEQMKLALNGTVAGNEFDKDSDGDIPF